MIITQLNEGINSIYTISTRWRRSVRFTRQHSPLLASIAGYLGQFAHRFGVGLLNSSTGKKTTTTRYYTHRITNTAAPKGNLYPREAHRWNLLLLNILFISCMSWKLRSFILSTKAARVVTGRAMRCFFKMLIRRLNGKWWNRTGLRVSYAVFSSAYGRLRGTDLFSSG